MSDLFVISKSASFTEVPFTNISSPLAVDVKEAEADAEAESDSDSEPGVRKWLTNKSNFATGS